MARSRILTLPRIASVLALSGCSTDALTTPRVLARSEAAASVLLPLDRFGVGKPQGPPAGDACGAAAFHAFDFWVGAWNVADAGGQLQGTDQVTRELGGCAIEEQWTDAAGGRGRSLNTYDASTGEWSQFWMDASGLQLNLAGGVLAGGIQLAGDRRVAFGGPVVTERITWSPITSDRVRQFWEFSDDGRQTWQERFEGFYVRQPSITPAPEQPIGFCDSPARFRYHFFDFAIGDWDVYGKQSEGRPRGRSTVTKDLSGCLVVEDLEGPGGYRGRAFAAFDFTVREWSRVYVDTDGVRLFLRGTVDGQDMVLAGSKRRANGENVLIRVVWSPEGTDRINQIWSFSSDGGATWTRDDAIVMVRR